MAKKIIGILLIILGLYIGLYVMLIGGIIQAVNAINPFDATNLAIGIVRALFFGLGFIPTYIGIFLLGRSLL